jgi:arylsulfatase A-like enzyme
MQLSCSIPFDLTVKLKLLPMLIVSAVAAVLSCTDLGWATPYDGPKVVIIEFHGLKQNIIGDNLDSLPNFKELIKGSGDHQSFIHLSNVFTTISAASVPACTSMYTSRYPQDTGVVSTIWFDRRLLKVRTMISYGQQRINRILSQNNIPTLFDYVRSAGLTSLNAMLMIDNGADWSIKSGLYFWGNGSVVGLFKNGRWFPDPWYMDHKTISAVLTGHLFAYHKSLSGLLKQKGIVPDVTVIQLLGTDIDSHFPEAALSQQSASINTIQTRYAQEVLDPQIGRLIRYFKENDIYERMIFFLVSQQGAIKITRHIPDGSVSCSLEPVFRLPDATTSNQKADAVVMPGACTKEVYLKNRQTNDWLHPPRLLADVKPAVDLILADEVLEESLNALAIRQYAGERNVGIPETDSWWGFNRQLYLESTQSNNDFLAALIPLADAFAHFELKDFVVDGLIRQYSRETTPDIKLVNKKGVYFEVDKHKYGHHGSYYPEDTLLSFWIAGPGLTKVIPGRHIVEKSASTLDLIPMLAYVLGIPQPRGIDGKNPLSGLKPN